MSIKYVKLPIYSVAVYGEYIYFAGGGGGSTGIPNQIKIYHQRITPEPVNSLETGKYIIQNLTVCESRQLLFCNANQFIVVYRVEENGRNLVELTRFQADFTKKHPNVNALCISNDGSVIMAGGQDMTVRFYNYSQNQPEIIHQYAVHNHQLKNVDHNQKDLFLSTDNHMIAICNLPKKQIVRTIYQDQLLPQKCYLRSAYFIKKESQEVAIVHFLSRTSTFITKESKGKFKTIEVANDQCSQTAYNPQVQILGVACGNGLTSLVSINNMKHLGSQNELKSGVNACVITRRSNLISGTSNCSYHIQGPSGSLSLPFPALLPSLLLTCIFIYLMGSVDDFEL